MPSTPFKQFKTIQLFLALYRTRIIRLLIPVFFIALIFWEGQHEIHKFHFSLALKNLRALSFDRVLLMLIFSLIAVAAMSAYDFLIRHHYQMKISSVKVFQYAWVANTFNNFLGFAGITGTGLRTVLYKKQQVPVSTVITASLFLAPAAVTGLSILSWLGIAGWLDVGPLLSNQHWLTIGVWIMALYLPLFILMQRSRLFSKWLNKTGETFSWPFITATLGASLFEWLFAGAAFWLISLQLAPGLPFTAALGIFTVAAVAGIISLAPGGLGSFDLTMIIGLHTFGLGSGKALAILVLFRLFYYIIPWLIGLVLAAKEIIPARNRINDWTISLWQGSLNRWQTFWSWPGQFRLLSDLGVWALAILVFSGGVLLLLSAATPGLLYRLKFTENLLSLPLMTLSQQLSVIIGVILIVLSRGIKFRIHRAYSLTVFILVAGAVFTFAKGFDYEEAIFLIIVASLLWFSRTRFYRISSPFSWKSVFIWVFLTMGVAIIYYIVGAGTHPILGQYVPAKVIRTLFLQPDEAARTAVIGLLGAWAFLSIGLLVRPKRNIEEKPGPQEIEKLKAFLGENPGNPLTHLLFLRDKSLFWAQNGEILIPYARTRDKLIVLGNPLGPRKKIADAIQEFQEFADRYTMVIAFYQVSSSYLPIYHENGYRFFKLGEEAHVDLATFSLSGKKRAGFRNACNRFDREGFHFEMLKPPFTDTILRELKTVSETWLKGRREKGFSLGWFDPHYLQLGPIATINKDEQIIAFATVMPGYDQETVSVDLMRHLPDAPQGTMDVLFIHLFEWAQKQEYKQFNLGVAPFSSVGENTNALREEKMARLVFQYGGHWYGFQGLRRYKEKFSPTWEPRYLAYPASASLPLLMMDIFFLISKSARENDHEEEGLL